MEFRVLRYFLTVAREENISAAANYLHLSQPTLSRQLMDLEQELGVKLFIRGNRKITLTEEGMLLRKRAEEIVDLVEKTESEMIASDDIVNGDIYIGGGETDAMRVIAGVVKDLQVNNHNIRFHLYSGNADDVTERLDKGLIDFGILIGAANVSKYDYLPLPHEDTWGVLMRKDSPLAAFDSIRPEQLWEVPLISSRQTLVNKDISSWIKKEYSELNLVATYNLVYNASIMVDEGIGYALCLDKLVNTTGASNLVFKPLNPTLSAGLIIVWKKYQVFSKAAELFYKKLQDELGT